ncbi:hypothetical protein O7635_21685 [Asanoa sp. WMMD1127]|uniref:hypothetical protein n=1 Tax=Asanoa sp. WMMD1127 TaxID=3016107 RepID=UPI0024180BE1|nr:hypothetical protein [Asanoa sp. WMMD1127]MDG4824471.1 hypothetical protein [Asanoa sp. WMMD1127]
MSELDRPAATRVVAFAAVSQLLLAAAAAVVIGFAVEERSVVAFLVFGAIIAASVCLFVAVTRRLQRIRSEAAEGRGPVRANVAHGLNVERSSRLIWSSRIYTASVAVFPLAAVVLLSHPLWLGDFRSSLLIYGIFTAYVGAFQVLRYREWRRGRAAPPDG